MRKYLIFVLASISLFRCGPSPLSGGVSDTGNIRVSAVMYNQDGSFAAGVPVTLCPSDYLELPDDNQHNNEKKVTVTNDSGYFCIDSLEPGTYSIEKRPESPPFFPVNLIYRHYSRHFTLRHPAPLRISKGSDYRSKQFCATPLQYLWLGKDCKSGYIGSL